MTDLPIVRRVADLRARIAVFRKAGHTVGLVPTMGALHEGHLALVQRAKAENDRVVATIFVNPTQFGPTEDLSAYPRDEAGDVARLAGADCDLLFAPDVTEMYPRGFSTSVTVSGITTHLDGVARPGHFGGVATIVSKLLLQSLPDRAYFGEKDFQQLQVIRCLARDLDMPVEIVGVPTVREADGLALSSRNRYLSPSERKQAAMLPQILAETARQLASADDAAPILAAATARLLQGGFARVDYVALCDEATLAPIASAQKGSRLFAAAHIGRTRLIDNWPVA
ncbi:pantoate--beta-alanine ligase [Dongia sp.]|uniref:pantoate--beta-alanine ligase n=1 Tax=Dongia sp. TaxID=1977262 RepID=UPI0035B22476